MRIHVRLYATLADHAPPDGTLDQPVGATIADVIKTLDIAADAARLTFVNGRSKPHATTLSDGDELAIFPPVGGG